MRTNAEINEQISRATDAAAHGSQYPGMSYEEGVRCALDWVIGESDDLPMEDD